MELQLGGQKVLITGGSRGIGRAIASSMAREGCDIHLSSRTEADLQRAQAEITDATGSEVSIHAFDLSESTNTSRLAEVCADVDILINNAGAIPGGNLGDVDESRWRLAWDLKVFGYINLTRLIYTRMQERHRGVILNIIGVAGERYDSNYIAGSTGNAGLMAFTRALGGTSLDDGVRVLGINPGLIATDRMTTLLQTRAEKELGDSSQWQELLKGLPLDRAGKPEEVADLATFLVSPRASYISGVIYTLDGGVAARTKVV